MYVQALDWPRRGKRLKKSEYKQALQVVNMTNTGNRMGMCPLYVGMRVRLTAKLSAKYGIVQDAVGQVQGDVASDVFGTVRSMRILLTDKQIMDEAVL